MIKPSFVYQALAGLVVLLLSTSLCPGAPFAAGNLVVYRIGTGTGALANTGNPVFLDEYTSAGNLVQSIPLPTVINGAQKRLIASGTAGSEGLMTRSADGRYLVLPGYDATPPHSSSLTGTASTAVNRVIGRVDALGGIDTSTAITDAYSANNFRGVCSDDGTHFWMAGNGNSTTGGVRYVAVLGATTALQLSTTNNNLRQPAIFGGQLYVSSGNGSTVRLGTVGSGLPGTAAQTITSLPGYPVNPNPNAFVLLDLEPAVAGVDTLYIADDAAGLLKYSFDGSTWTARGSAGASGDFYRGLTASTFQIPNPGATLFAVRKGGDSAAGGGEIVVLTDTGGSTGTLNGTPALLAAAAANTAFRGIAFAPQRPDLTVAVAGPGGFSIWGPPVSLPFTRETFFLHVRLGNGGGGSAYNVGGQFTLPAGLTYVMDTAQAAGFQSSHAGGVLTFSGGTLAAQSSAIIEIGVRTEVAGAYALAADAAVIDPLAQVDESDETNNGSSSAGSVEVHDAADLKVTLSGPATALTGTTGFEYTLTAANEGLAAAPSVSVTFTLPEGLTFVSGSGAGFTVAETDGVVTFSGGSLASDQTETLAVRISAVADGSYTAPIGTAAIGSGAMTMVDSDLTNNTSPVAVTTTVLTSDLAISQTANGPFQAGDSASYTLTVSNAGTTATQGQVIFNDVLPAGFTATSLSGTGWSIVQGTGGSVSATRNDVLPSGQSYPPLTLTVAIAANAPGTVTHAPTISGGGDSIQLNNSSTVNTPILGAGPGVIAFEPAAWEIPEESGPLVLTLRRTNGRTGAVSVTVNTSNGTALADSDFTGLTDAIIHFADNVDTATVTVPITQDNLAESNESFGISLSSPTGGASLGSLSSVTVLILDPDAVKPKVAVNSPKAGERLNEGVVTASIEITENKQLRRVEVKLNGGGFTEAVLPPVTTGKTLFTLPLSPAPGVNTLVVRATDMRGNVSDDLTRLFTYVVKRPLTLLYPSDSGIVTLKPAEPLTALELGKTYSLTAKPAAGRVWNGWSSPQLALTEDRRLGTTLSFTMTEGLSITADFAEDPFKPAVIGDFTGLVRADGSANVPPLHDHEGAFQVKVTPKGSFSGSLRIAGQTFPLAGVLDTSGTARFGAGLETSLLVGRAPLPGYVLAFNADLNAAGTKKITGTLRRQTQAGSGPMSVIEANRHAFDGKTPATTAAEAFYNWAMPAQPQTNGLAVSHYPQGDGVGSIKISKTGAATVAGVLADGTAFTTSASLSAGLHLPLFLSLEKGAGSLNGWLAVDHTRPDTDVSGQALHWFKPVIAGASRYPFGWPEGLTLALQGARFATPVGESVLPDLTEITGANAVLGFTQGALTVPLQKELSVSPTNLVTRIPASDASYTLKLDAKTGQFSGSFTHSDLTTATYTGIILQKGANRRGFGHFLSTPPKTGTGAGQGGAVSLKTKFNPRLTLVISEFMADNESTLADEDGTFSDWIEIYNPGSEEVNLTGWCLTDNAAALGKWRFPVVTLGPRQFMLVWASSKNRRTPGQPLHTNFSLSNGGEYLALVRPDGVTVEHEFAPVFPPQANNESYGINFSGRSLAGQGATVRYHVPKNAALGSTWTTRDFADNSWSQGKTGLGFGVGVPGFTVRQVAAKPAFGGVGTITSCDALLALPKGHANILSEATVIAPVINYLGDGSENDGHYPGNAALPNGLAEPYAFKAAGIITIPETGSYVFGLNSDDGGRIKIDGVAVMTDDSNHGPQDNLSAPVNLTAGAHAVEVIMWEGGGGDCVEFWAKAGTDTSWNEGFKLVGSPDGLQVVTAPLTSSGSATGLVATNLQSAMQTKNASCYLRLPFTVSGLNSLTGLTLQMRYNDGFVAYLNGTEVARRNAPSTTAFDSAATATRSAVLTLTAEAIDLSAHIPLLVGGTNVLAVHGMNDTRDDGSFLLLPELSATGGLAGNAVFFRPTHDVITATPGTLNGVPQFAGIVSPLVFSQKHGFYKSALSLSITSATAGTSVRYTLDGSTPTATHGTLYTGPVAIKKTSIVRAIGFKDGFEPTPVLTQSYFFLEDVIRQSANGARPSNAWPAGSVNGQVSDYGMDPDVVNSTNPEIGGVDQVKSALTAIPTLSIVTDLPNLFSQESGIWVNPYNRGEAWERPASVEMIGDSGPGGGFEINCGLRLRGGFSRAGNNPKHSLRLFFRNQYGASKLNYPLFGNEGTDSFDKIDLRTAQNYSWSFQGDENNNTFIREESTRELQGAMGQPYSRSRYYHLYLNGQYWGLYDTDERPEANFAESYIGGDADDYDTVKGEQDQGYITGVTDGNLDAWEALRVKARAHAADPTNANYFAMSGKGADGMTSTADPVLLQPDSLIDYMLLTFWTGNMDGATSAFLSDARANNWFAVRNRLGTFGGFRFIAHDFEHTFLNPFEDRTGPFPNADHDNAEIYNPMFLHHDLRPNMEYRMQWADRVQKHLFGQGALTLQQVQARMRARKAVLDRPVIAESARWGDAQRGNGSPLNRQHWQNAVDYVIEDYLPVRGGHVLAQLREDGLYPSFDAPSLSQNGGPIASGTEVIITGNGGTMHYTLDGSDPRQVGGAINPAAQTYTSSTQTDLVVPLNQIWKYLADGSNQGTAWRAGTFNDSGWPGGAAELGYGDDQTTEVPYVDVDPVAAGDQKNATTYFRTGFTVADTTGLTAAALRVKYDDAVILYLNGTEVARSANISSNPAHNQYASGSTPDENTFFDFPIDPALLIAGENVLAAEVHQADSASTDISFNVSLSITRTDTPTPLYLTGTGSRTLKVRALNSGEWSALVEAEFDVREAPDMQVFLTRNGTFTAGSPASYTVAVRNNGTVASSGPVTTTITLPAGLTATSLTGIGWTILQGTGSTLVARRPDTLATGTDYPLLTVNVSIAMTAPALASTTASVHGGGEITLTNNTDTDATPVESTGPSQILFSSATYEALEAGSSLAVTILRTGDRTGSASVRLRNADGTAKAATDYESRDEVITFAEGETSRTIDIGLNNDGRTEPHEAFKLTLSDATGAVSLGLPNVASARILEEDNTAPTVALTTPTAGARVVLPALILTGTATDDKGLGKVQVSLNNGGFIDAVTTLDAKGTSGKFTLNVPALTGTNAVRIRAVDARGLVSNEAAHEFTFAPQRPLGLTLLPADGGTVSLAPAGNLALLEVGKTYTLTARPNKGFIFDHWTGPGIDRESPTLTFTMSEDLDLSAHFATMPFSIVNSGTYLALVHNADGVSGTHENHGLASLNVTPGAAFTGTVRLGGTGYPVKGTLNAEGYARFGTDRDASLTILRPNQNSLVLVFRIDPATRTLEGTLGTRTRSAIEAMSVFHGARKRAPLAAGSPLLAHGGKYSVTMTHTPPSPGAAGYPAVTTATLAGTLSKQGVFTLAGTLADNTKLTSSADLLESGSMALHVLPAGNASSLAASLVWNESTPAVSASEGRWFRLVTNIPPYPYGWPAGLPFTITGVQPPSN